MTLTAVLNEPKTNRSTFKPGETKEIELEFQEINYIQISQIAKIALISSVVGSLELYNKLKAEDSRFEEQLGKFLNSGSETYLPCLPRFISSLYFLSPPSPTAFIAEYLDTRIEPVNKSLFSRWKDAVEEIKLECELLDVSLDKDLMPECMDKNNHIALTLRSIMMCISDDIVEDVKLDSSLTSLMELYDVYGKRHSTVHFIEFVAISLMRILTVKPLKIEDLPHNFKIKLTDYEPGRHPEISLLPFAMTVRSQGKLKVADIIEKVKEMKLNTTDNDIVKIATKLGLKQSFLPDSIIATRNLISAVFCSLSMPEETTKSTPLNEYLAQGTSLELDSLRQAVGDFKRHLVTYSTNSSSLMTADFDKLTVYDVASTDGKVQHYLTGLLEAYRHDARLVATLLSKESLPSKKLTAVRLPDMIQLDLDCVYKDMCKHEARRLNHEGEFKRVLRGEVYKRINWFYAIDNDIGKKKFIFSGANKVIVLNLMKELTSKLQLVQIPAEKSLKAKILRIKDFRQLLEIENQLEIALNGLADQESDCSKPIQLPHKLKVVIAQVSDFYQMVLLKKLEIVYTENKKTHPNRTSHILLKALSSAEITTKAITESLLVQAAAKETDQSIFAYCRLDATEIDTQVTLSSIPILRSIMADLITIYPSLETSNIRDLLFASQKLCSSD